MYGGTSRLCIPTDHCRQYQTFTSLMSLHTHCLIGRLLCDCDIPQRGFSQRHARSHAGRSQNHGARMQTPSKGARRPLQKNESRAPVARARKMNVPKRGSITGELHVHRNDETSRLFEKCHLKCWTKCFQCVQRLRSLIKSLNYELEKKR